MSEVERRLRVGDLIIFRFDLYVIVGRDVDGIWPAIRTTPGWTRVPREDWVSSLDFPRAGVKRVR
jgi:hypothetical protein